MRKMLTLIVLFLMFTIIWGESVILNDGRTLIGEIVGKKGDNIYLDSEGSIYLIRRDLVQKIKNEGNQPVTRLIYRKKDFKKEGMIFDSVIEIVSKDQFKKDGSVFMHGIQKTHETKLNWKTITLSMLFAGLAWDYFATAGDYSDTIKKMEDAGSPDKEIDKVKKIKTRKTITGSLLTAASVVSFAISFERVEIKASSTSVEIGYKF